PAVRLPPQCRRRTGRRYQGSGATEEFSLQRQTGKRGTFSARFAGSRPRVAESDFAPSRKWSGFGQEPSHVGTDYERAGTRDEPARPNRGPASWRPHESRSLERSGRTGEGQACRSDVRAREDAV